MTPPSPIGSSTSIIQFPTLFLKHFGEYELFLSLIGLSPLPTAHPEAFQRLSVRSSTLFYQSFNLAMGRSLSFASTPTDYNALFGLAFAAAPPVYRINLAGEE